jgi:dTDP-4-dehydrorhamnose reductase
MKVLILGAGGMLGFTLLNYLNTKKNITLFGTIRNKSLNKNLARKILNDVDAKKFSLLAIKIGKISPDVVINCVGIVKSEVEDNVKNVTKINSKLPNFLNKLSKKLSFRLLHISTDCVFSGKKYKYSEKNLPDPIDFYGKSKLMGEFKSNKNIVIRTSIIGHEIKHKRGLLEWFLKQNSTISGYSKAYFSGLTTLELSKIIYEKFLFNIDLTGLYHISGKRINKYTLLKKISKIYNKNTPIKKDNTFKIDRSLNSSKFIKRTNYKKKSWDKMIKENKINFFKYAK